MAKAGIANSKEIKRFINRTEKEIDIEKIIIFGSYAWGKQNKCSDIDLAVISDDFKLMNHFERMVYLGKLAWWADAVTVEALGFTLDEYKNATKLDFLGEIKRTGKIIYEK